MLIGVRNIWLSDKTAALTRTAAAAVEAADAAVAAAAVDDAAAVVVSRAFAPSRPPLVHPPRPPPSAPSLRLRASGPFVPPCITRATAVRRLNEKSLN
ncbi:unnamed protein product [Closterium sp. NIES-54]